MDSQLLSKITKDFLNTDSDFVPPRERYRIGWGGSILSVHEKAPRTRTNKKEGAARLLSLREKLGGLFHRSDGSDRSIPLSTSPRLAPPALPSPGTFRPPWYFSKGTLERNRKKNPEPIPHLLTETNETAKPRPVPGNSQLLRSLCKGKGRLRKNKEGFVYLDIDNLFISMILPYLKRYDLVRPPYFNLFHAPEGAHIPVISTRESSFQYLDYIETGDRECSFQLEGLYSMEPLFWPEVEQVWFFQVDSPDLEHFRRRYFLSAHPGGHPFHIAVAVQPRVSARGIPFSHPVMRVNSAFLYERS